MARPFVHLHVHTEYSLLDGAIRTAELARKVASWEIPAVAMTDHGAMYGIIEFYEQCRAKNVKPILGCEIYVDPDGHRSREKKGKNNHLLLLAENDEGYHNLVKLVSIANTDGFYYKPRIDHDLLARYHKGLIVSSACLAGEIPQLILADKEKEATDRALLYRDIVGKDNFFLEVMINQISAQAKVNKALIRMSKETGIPLIATNDAHYLEKDDYDWHKILLKVNTHADETDDAFGFSSNDFYLRSPEEMNDLFGPEMPEALDNTAEIAARCNVSLDLGSGSYQLPSIELTGTTLEKTLEDDARKGLSWRLKTEPPEEYQKRLEYELSVINSMGFAGYFLIVAGIIQAAKSRNIPIGPGRGSAAGSLVAWSLQITDLDPLKYGLLFERFLNPERISMPDIDTDVSDKGREELLKYIVERYGSDRVSQIITFGRMKSRQAVKDVGRATGVEYSLMDKVAKLIPFGAKSIGEAIQTVPDLKEIIESNSQVSTVIKVAEKIEGLARHPSQHAAGVVITPVPVTDLVPIRRIKGTDAGTSASGAAGMNVLDISQTVTQFTMEPIEKLGLVKMDFLGLSTLSIIEDALANIHVNGKSVPDMSVVPMDDPATYQMLQNGDTLGVFQLESAGMRRLLQDLKVDCFEDLIAVLAMYRPGPLGSGMVKQYVECKHGRAKAEYPHPLLEDVLRETHGVILYQEQVMQCASILAGYTLGEADLLRRAMGKKKVEVMRQQRAKFVEGAGKKGIKGQTAEHIFDLIQEFAGYGFNKSHSAAYAMISYHTAYLKANYRSEFMAAYLSSQMKAKKDVLGKAVREIRRSGVNVLPPDINSSMENFTAVGDVIRFGLGAVAKVGHNTVEAIVDARSGGKFTSLWDFVSRVDMEAVPKSAVESLIKAGAFDEIFASRTRLAAALPDFIQMIQKKNKDNGQYTLFEVLGSAEEAEEPDMPEVQEDDTFKRLEQEKAVMGIYISGHPFDKYEEKALKYATCTIGELSFWTGSIPAKVGGIILSVTDKVTKSGKSMGLMNFEDSDSSIEMVCFPREWETLKTQVQVGCPYIAEGKTGDREPKNFIVQKLTLLEDNSSDNSSSDSPIPHSPAFVRIRLRADLVADKLDFKDFAVALKDCPGRSPVLLELMDERDSCVLALQGISVGKPSALQLRLAEVVPPEAFEVA
ncbi:MAG: DNA polymerase III subunit alpha [Synergistaceae bacterium]|jgi:DNA polymerase-3 subunit alpha|nr:DNA polymerase III subunit alpha [Synergistaceae bacterium]